MNPFRSSYLPCHFCLTCCVLNIATSQSSDSNILLTVVLMKMMTYLTKALIKNWTSINLLVHWRNHSHTAPVWRLVSGCSTSSSSSPPSPRVSLSSVLSSLYIPLPRCCRTDDPSDSDLTNTHNTTLHGAPQSDKRSYFFLGQEVWYICIRHDILEWNLWKKVITISCQLCYLICGRF